VQVLWRVLILPEPTAPSGAYGFKHENIYRFHHGRLVEL
jgi:hypothetical protein